MKQINSISEECHNLTVRLAKELKPKISIFEEPNQGLISGQYNCLPLSFYSDEQTFIDEAINYTIEIREGKYLRITIQKGEQKCSLGNRLAALSDFYSILRKMYDEATVFFTTKEDEKESLHLEWSFTKKQDAVNAFVEGDALEGTETELIIAIDEEDSQTLKMSRATRDYISERIKLPYELLLLVELDVDNFIYYKMGTGFEKRLNQTKQELPADSSEEPTTPNMVDTNNSNNKSNASDIKKLNLTTPEKNVTN